MSRYFADTYYWVALTSPREPSHARAIKFSAGAGRHDGTVTTEEVLTEFLAFFSGGGPYWRNRAVRVVQGLRSSAMVRVFPQTSLTFEDGLQLYFSRPDKGYSLTDCISMQTMRREGLSDVLTNDRHLEQEGFRAIFR